MKPKALRVKTLVGTIICLIPMLFSTMNVSALSESGYSNRIANFNKSGFSLSGNLAKDLVSFAKLQAGKTGAQLGYDDEWCAAFISDCGRYVGYDWTWTATPSYFKKLGTVIYTKGGTLKATPQPGDIAIIGWNNNGACDHVEIVTEYIPVGKCSKNVGNGTLGGVVTVGGNTGSGGSYKTRVVKNRTTPVNTNWGKDGDASNCISYIVRPSSQNANKYPTITASSAISYPTTIKYGKSFSVKGTLAVDYGRIAYVHVYIVGTNQDYSWYPNTKTVNLKSADSHIQFKKLKRGKYTYRVEAMAQNGSYVGTFRFEKTFTVK